MEEGLTSDRIIGEVAVGAQLYLRSIIKICCVNVTTLDGTATPCLQENVFLDAEFLCNKYLIRYFEIPFKGLRLARLKIFYSIGTLNDNNLETYIFV